MGDPEAAEPLLLQAIRLYEAESDRRAAARVQLRVGQIESSTGRTPEAIARLEQARETLTDETHDETLANLAATLSFGYFYTGDPDRGFERAELALDISEAHGYPLALTRALRAKAGISHTRGHPEEGRALLARSLEIAREHDLVDEVSTCLFWMSDTFFQRDMYAQSLGYLEESLALARRRGSRPQEWAALAERTYPLYMLGRWDEAMAQVDSFTQEQVDAGGVMLSMLQVGVAISVHRDDVERARAIYAMFGSRENSSDLQEFSGLREARAAIRRGEGRLEEALDDYQTTIDAGLMGGIAEQAVKHAIGDAIEAALTLGDGEKAESLLARIEKVPVGTRPPLLHGHVLRFRARIARSASGLADAAAVYRELETPYWLALALLELGELTSDATALNEAREIFERLEAVPWAQRAAQAGDSEVLSAVD
jgi:tetratricopeptide (TPR) repeat protein